MRFDILMVGRTFRDQRKWGLTFKKAVLYSAHKTNGIVKGKLKMASTVGKVIKRLFLWDSVYYLTWQELPDDGLFAAYREVGQYNAKAGISADPDFTNMAYDMERELKRRGLISN